MKKITILLAALAAAFAVSCTKESPVETPDTSAPAGMKMVTITASVDDAATKTSYTQDGTDPTLLKFSWTKGDQIAIKGSDNQFYTFTTTETASAATFTGYMPEDVTLQKHALYPAESAVKDASAGYFYTIPEYKDLTDGFSADIPMSSYVSAGTYNFKHMTGAVLLTFTNIPDGVGAVEISIKANQVRLSGTQQIWSGEPFTFTAANAANDSEKTFTRKLSVENNQVKLYLPYKGGFWDTCVINIIGYDDDGNQIVLLKDKAMRGTSANDFTPGLVIPYAPLALPDYIDFSKVDWDNATISTVSDNDRFKSLNVIADSKYLYLRLNPVNQTPFGADYLDVSFCDGNGANPVWWGWTTTGTNVYWKEHKGTVDETGTLTAMQYSHNGTYQNILCKSEVVDGEIYWYLAYPREYVDVYTSPEGKIYVSCLLWNAYANYWAIPVRDGSMLEVTLP